jgi:hypothetical protein
MSTGSTGNNSPILKTDRRFAADMRSASRRRRRVTPIFTTKNHRKEIAMPSEEDLNSHHWLTFGAAPLSLLAQRSLIFRQLGASNLGGPCIVAGGRHLDAVGTNGATNLDVALEYESGTAVSALTTTPGGDGTTYWYPYVETGVGECDVSYDVPLNTTALTAGMNGCSLRIYVNPAKGLIKFCHDNNGLYADDAAYAAKGFQHLQSINADDRMRGLPAQNVNDYWEAAIRGPASGIYFICMKTAAMQWTIYQSVAIGGRREERIPGVFRASTRVVHPFTGRQSYNKVVVVVDIPPLTGARRSSAATTDDLPV